MSSYLFDHKYLVHCCIARDLLVLNNLSQQALTLLGVTSYDYQTMEIIFTLKNIRTRHRERCQWGNVTQMLILTQKATGRMGTADCKPYCEGLQRCDVTDITVDVANGAERHVVKCHCHGDGMCRDFALWLPTEAAIDPEVPMEICNAQTYV